MKNFLIQLYKWILFPIWVLSSIIPFALLTDTTESFFNVIIYLIYFVWTIIGCGFLYFWFELFEVEKRKIYLFACNFIIVLFVSSLVVYGYTKYKMNKDYFLYAYHPTNSHHQWKYYFRDNNTLKVHGLYAMREEYHFYDFDKKGGTLFFDKILKHEGLESKIYLIKQNNDTLTKSNFKAFLIPLDESYNCIESLEKMIVPVQKK